LNLKLWYIVEIVISIEKNISNQWVVEKIQRPS